MFDFRNKSKLNSDKKKISVLNYMRSLNRRVFEEWKNIHLVYKHTRAVFNKIWKRHYRDKLFTGISAIRSFSI